MNEYIAGSYVHCIYFEYEECEECKKGHIENEICPIDCEDFRPY